MPSSSPCPTQALSTLLSSQREQFQRLQIHRQAQTSRTTVSPMFTAETSLTLSSSLALGKQTLALLPATSSICASMMPKTTPSPTRQQTWTSQPLTLVTSSIRPPTSTSRLWLLHTRTLSTFYGRTLEVEMSNCPSLATATPLQP